MAGLRLEPKEAAAAFEEWDRRYRENPREFMNEVEHLLGETPETYGEACGPYFMALVREMRKKELA